MSRCAECGFDWQTPSAVLPLEIGNIGDQYHRAVSALTGPGSIVDLDAAIRRRPGQGIWSPLEYLAHMRDVVSFYDDRIQRVLAEHRPHFPPGVRFAELAEVRSYRTEDPLAVLDDLAKGAVKVAQRLGRLNDADWERVGIGSGGDERSLLVLARRIVHEGQHHLLDVQRLADGAPGKGD